MLIHALRSQRLCLGIRGQDCTVTHVVKPGQTCLEIAATVGTTINILLANNPNLDSDCTTLYSDEASISTHAYIVASLMLSGICSVLLLIILRLLMGLLMLRLLVWLLISRLLMWLLISRLLI